MLITDQHLGRLFRLDYRMDLYGLAVGMVGTLKAYKAPPPGRTGTLLFLAFPIGPQKLVTPWVASTSCTLLGPEPLRAWPRLVHGEPWVEPTPQLQPFTGVELGRGVMSLGKVVIPFESSRLQLDPKPAPGAKQC